VCDQHVAFSAVVETIYLVVLTINDFTDVFHPFETSINIRDNIVEIKLDELSRIPAGRITQEKV